MSKPVNLGVSKEPDEEGEFREFIKPAQLTFKNGAEYKATFHRLLKLELDHELLHKADGQTEKEVRKRFDSEARALAKFEKNEGKLNLEIYQIMLGKRKIGRPKTEDQPLDLDAYQSPSIPLNQSSAFAVKHSLENPFTLIQGRPLWQHN